MDVRHPTDTAATAPVRLRQGEHKGWDAWWIERGPLALALAPQPGWTDDLPFLDLDSGGYTHEILVNDETCASVRMTSPTCRETGIEISRTVTVSADSATWTVSHRITNRSDEPATWAVWDVSMLTRPGRVYLPVSGGSEYPGGLKTFDDVGASVARRPAVVESDIGVVAVDCSKPGSFKYGVDRRRIEDRDPADAEAVGPRRQPQGVHGGDYRISQHLRHGAPAEPVAERRRGVGINGEMHRRAVEPGQFQRGVEPRPLTMVVGQGVAVAGLETGPHRLAAHRVIDLDEAPRLAVADRRRQAGERNQPVDQRPIDRVFTEPPHVAAPAEQRLELVAESVVEGGWGGCRRGFVHRRLLVDRRPRRRKAVTSGRGWTIRVGMGGERTRRAGTCRRLVAVATAILAFLAAPGGASAQAGDGDEAAAWAALKAGGRLALIRHAEAPGTGDPPGFKLDDCTTQRNLSTAGREQARAIGRSLRQADIPVDRVLSSEWCRCLETAELMAVGPVDTLPALNSFHDFPERERPQMAALRIWVATTEPQGTAILVTHQVVIRVLVGIPARSGEIVVVEPYDDSTVTLIGRIPPP